MTESEAVKDEARRILLQSAQNHRNYGKQGLVGDSQHYEAVAKHLEEIADLISGTASLEKNRFVLAVKNADKSKPGLYIDVPGEAKPFYLPDLIR